jgi:site-specific DNA-methyltransferase (cytosine-N4-specific)
MLDHLEPFYKTKFGIAYLGDSREILKDEDLTESVDLIMTSPPFALKRKRNMATSMRVNTFLGFLNLPAFSIAF